jgi:protein-tyrosine phosphatase
MSSELTWNWLLPGELAIGSHPQTDHDWQLLRQAGINAVFNCCYPDEDLHLPAVPAAWGWRSLRCPLPDHRAQVPLQEDTLKQTLEALCDLYADSDCLYVHCWAGQERSVLMGIGLLALQQQLTIFQALDHTKRQHPPARPLFAQLALLEQVLNAPYGREETR